MNLRLAIVLLCGAACAQTPDNPFAGEPNAVAAGYSVFRPYCGPCHGIHAEGGRGPDLTRRVFRSGDKDSNLFHAIADGLRGTGMKGFGGEISDDDIWRIVVYLRSITSYDKTAVPGDRANGEKIFWAKGACGSCHLVAGRGGRLGPELTRIGSARSLQYLRDAVLDPDQDILPGWATITVTKLDGTKLTGVERGFDNFSVQLMDMAGNYYSFLRAGVASVTRENRSLMPADYGRRLKPGEVDDVIAYLVALHDAEAPH